MNESSNGPPRRPAPAAAAEALDSKSSSPIPAVPAPAESPVQPESHHLRQGAGGQAKLLLAVPLAAGDVWDSVAAQVYRVQLDVAAHVMDADGVAEALDLVEDCTGAVANHRALAGRRRLFRGCAIRPSPGRSLSTLLATYRLRAEPPPL